MLNQFYIPKINSIWSCCVYRIWFANILFWILRGCQWIRFVYNFPSCTGLAWFCSWNSSRAGSLLWMSSWGQRQCSCVSHLALRGLRDHWLTPFVAVGLAGFPFLLEAVLVANIFLGICPFHLFSNLLATKKKSHNVLLCFSYVSYLSPSLFDLCLFLQCGSCNSTEQDSFQTEADTHSSLHKSIYLKWRLWVYLHMFLFCPFWVLSHSFTFFCFFQVSTCLVNWLKI